jgi:hypothetical protein
MFGTHVIGGGTGGGPGSYNIDRNVDGNYVITANQVALLSRTPLPPSVPNPNVITIMAGDLLGMSGTVNVRGYTGVRLTAGPPPLPATESNSTDGVEIEIGETGSFTLKRGLIPEVDQKMEVTSSGVTVDAGSGEVTIKSLSKITLSVAEGMTQITLGPEGVTIEALQIQLSAQVQAMIQGLMTQLSGSAMTQISGGITMIG